MGKAGETVEIALSVNGKKRRLDVAPMKRLLDTLREDLGLTGTKEGCGEGECGACSVLIDGEVVNACLVPTCQAEGHEVTTIEGLGASVGKEHGKKKLHALQSSFLELGGAQCGICTPGMILAAAALPKRPSMDEIREGLAGNLCRCTGYTRIYEAVRDALGTPKEEARAEKQAAKAEKKAAKADEKAHKKAAKADKKAQKKATKAAAPEPVAVKSAGGAE
jgi:aerobic-type carbon monoxide dehydrogenase small subunit (CoxS/CutS family)